MLRELSIKARRRRENSQMNNTNQPPPTNIPPSASNPNPTYPNVPQQRSSRTLSSIPRRLSIGPASFQRASSFLSSRQNRNRNPSQPRSIPRPKHDDPSHSVVRPRARPARSDLTPHRQPPTYTPRTVEKTPPREAGKTYPLESVDELMKWRPSAAAAKCVSRVPLSESAKKRFIKGQIPAGRPTLDSTLSTPASTAARGAAGSLKRLNPPRLLLCHDFKGGYPSWEARADGARGDQCPEDTQLWRFNHWTYVDLFVYFSRNRVTIPPVGYIQAGHRHGTLVLGTLFFEGDAGKEELSKIILSYKTRARTASQLATLAKFYGFDGWMVSADMDLPGGSASASDLAAFVGDLLRATKKIVGQACSVIWQDSIARDGAMRPQNEVNQENELYFKAASGFFTKFEWDRNAPVRSAVKAATRRTEVFTGIDIHGRNTFGGGGFQSHIALRAIKQGGTSAALFAPAWTVEKCPPNVEDPRDLEERFWTGPAIRFGKDSVAQYFKERAVVLDIPFETNFDPGWGARQFKNGALIGEEKYFNMAQQQVQPSFMRTYVAAGDTKAAELSMSQEEALSGSSAIKVQFAFSDSRLLTGSFSILRLLVANVQFPTRLSSRISKSQDGAVQISYDFLAKSDKDACAAGDDFGIVLLFGSPPSLLFLVGEKSKWNLGKSGRGYRMAHHIQVLGRYLSYTVCTPDSERRSLGAPTPEEGSTGWITRNFILDGAVSSGQRVVEALIIVGGPAEAPVSMRPSPFMSPSGSRLGSRQGSRYGSRLGSRAGSRSNSPPRARRDDGDLEVNQEMLEERQSSFETASIELRDDRRQRPRGAIEGPGASLLDKYRESFNSGARRRSEYVGGGTYNRSSLVNRAQTSVEGTGADRRPPPMPRLPGVTRADALERRRAAGGSVLQRTYGREDERANEQAADEGAVRPSMADLTQRLERIEASRSGSRRGSYSHNFRVGGNIEFDNLQQDVGYASQSHSRASSRLGSRLPTPMGSRPGSLYGSRAGSLAASLAASRNASRVGSRQTSRTVSPSRTPQSGEKGISALTDLRDGPLAGLSGRSDGGAGMAGATPAERRQSSLNDLKAAIMNAAGSMAGSDERRSAGSLVGGTSGNCTVYLGRISISQVKQSDESMPTAYHRPSAPVDQRDEE